MQGDKLNFTFAASKYVPSGGFIVNATALQRYPGMPRLALWCGVSDGERRNDSAPLPTRASALKPPGRSRATSSQAESVSIMILPQTPGLACWQNRAWSEPEANATAAALGLGLIAIMPNDKTPVIALQQHS